MPPLLLPHLWLTRKVGSLYSSSLFFAWFTMLGCVSVSSCASPHIRRQAQPCITPQSCRMLSSCAAHLGAEEDIVCALHAQHEGVVLVAHLHAHASCPQRVRACMCSVAEQQAGACQMEDVTWR